MKHNQISEANKPIMALSESLSLAVNDNNWIGFIGYSDFLVDLIGLVSDRSISPNRSTILRSLFDIVNHVSVLLLEKGEYYQFTEYTERAINRYCERNKENETGDVISYLAEDMVINSFIKAIYDEIWKLAIEDRDYVYQRIKQLDMLKTLQLLFSRNENPNAFQSVVSTQFFAIHDNASLNNDQKTQILKESVKELYRITERDLSRFHADKYPNNKDVVFDFYIYD